MKIVIKRREKYDDNEDNNINNNVENEHRERFETKRK